MTLQSRAKVGSDGNTFPDKYCERVGRDIPNSSAITLFGLPQASISRFKFILIFFSISSIVI